MQHWYGPLFPFDIIINLINFILCASIIVFFSLKYKIKRSYLYLLLMTLIAPLLLNGPLMSWEYLPDQTKYLKETIDIRNLDFQSLDGRKSIFYPSLIFSLTPIPIIQTFNDIGLINRTFISLLIIYLIKNKTKEIFIYFLILSPSLLLYSSVALKETLVIILTILSFEALLKKRYLFFFLPLIFLIIFKKQNGYIILPMFFFYIYYFNFNFKFKNTVSLLLILIIIFSIFINEDFIISTINYFRYNFFHEDTGGFGFDGFKNNFDLIFQIPFNYLRFIISPFPEITSPIKLIIFIENMIVVGLFFYYSKKLYKNNLKIFYYWFIFFILFLSMYSLTIFNHGTISRYKLSFIVPFLFVLVYLNHNFCLKLKKNE